MIRLQIDIREAPPLDEDGRRRHGDQLASLDMEVRDEVAWELYRHCVGRLTEPTSGIGPDPLRGRLP